MPHHLTLTTDFFQPNRMYTDGDGFRAPELTRTFDVELVTRHPDRGHLRAVGWMSTAEPGAERHMQAIDEDEYEPGEWHPYTRETTLLGHPLSDGPTPVLLACTYSWDCGCHAPALIVYADGPDLTTATDAANAAAWNHVLDFALGAPNGGLEHTGHHNCDTPSLRLVSVLGTSYAAAPQIHPLPGHAGHTVLRVHAELKDGEAA